MKDYYKVLNIDRNANGITIKKAYRKLALKHHPDTKNDKEKKDLFLEINEAYQVLNDHRKRLDYNKLYDYYILGKRPKKQTSFNHRQNTWKSNVNRAAKKGRERGEKYSTESETVFQSRVGAWALYMAFDILFEVVWSVIIGIINLFN